MPAHPERPGSTESRTVAPPTRLRMTRAPGMRAFGDRADAWDVLFRRVPRAGPVWGLLGARGHHLWCIAIDAACALTFRGRGGLPLELDVLDERGRIVARSAATVSGRLQLPVVDGMLLVQVRNPGAVRLVYRLELARSAAACLAFQALPRSA